MRTSAVAQEVAAGPSVRPGDVEGPGSTGHDVGGEGRGSAGAVGAVVQGDAVDVEVAVTSDPGVVVTVVIVTVVA